MAREGGEWPDGDGAAGEGGEWPDGDGAAVDGEVDNARGEGEQRCGVIRRQWGAAVPDGRRWPWGIGRRAA